MTVTEDGRVIPHWKIYPKFLADLSFSMKGRTLTFRITYPGMGSYKVQSAQSKDSGLHYSY